MTPNKALDTLNDTLNGLKEATLSGIREDWEKASPEKKAKGKGHYALGGVIVVNGIAADVLLRMGPSAAPIVVTAMLEMHRELYRWANEP